MTEVLRTPDERFDTLPDWPYAPRYIDDLAGYEGLRCHYVDEGPRDAGSVFLCLHGEPTWSFLYRRMIPVFTAAGGRVVAPDFFGFGRSDKPVDEAWYGFHRHRDFLLRFIERLDLGGITLVCQDWGGLLGLTLPMDAPERFERLLVMNTALAVGGTPGAGFEAWKQYVRDTPDLPVGRLMQRTTPHLTEAEAAAYDAPFPDTRYKAGVRRFPEMVMVAPDMEGVKTSRRAADWWAREWSGKTFMAIGMQDPVLGPVAMHALAGQLRGCPAPMEVADAGHFVQEWGDDIARAALAHFDS